MKKQVEKTVQKAKSMPIPHEKKPIKTQKTQKQEQEQETQDTVKSQSLQVIGNTNTKKI